MQYQDYHGLCTNQDAISDFTECKGTCNSYTHFNKGNFKTQLKYSSNWNISFFSAESAAHDSNCTCCQPTAYRSITVQLSCPDGEVVNRAVTVPSACSCIGCGADQLTSMRIVGPSYAGVKGPRHSGVKGRHPSFGGPAFVGPSYVGPPSYGGPPYGGPPSYGGVKKPRGGGVKA